MVGSCSGPGFVLVKGPTGIGKTYLLSDLADTIKSRDQFHLLASCSESENPEEAVVSAFLRYYDKLGFSKRWKWSRMKKLPKTIWSFLWLLGISSAKRLPLAPNPKTEEVREVFSRDPVISLKRLQKQFGAATFPRIIESIERFVALETSEHPPVLLLDASERDIPFCRVLLSSNALRSWIRLVVVNSETTNKAELAQLERDCALEVCQVIEIDGITAQEIESFGIHHKVEISPILAEEIRSITEGRPLYLHNWIRGLSPDSTPTAEDVDRLKEMCRSALTPYYESLVRQHPEDAFALVATLAAIDTRLPAATARKTFSELSDRAIQTLMDGRILTFDPDVRLAHDAVRALGSKVFLETHTYFDVIQKLQSLDLEGLGLEESELSFVNALCNVALGSTKSIDDITAIQDGLDRVGRYAHSEFLTQVAYRALRDDPEKTEQITLLLADVLTRRAKYAEVEEVLSELTESDAYLISQGRLHYHQGNYDAATASLATIGNENRDWVDAQRMLSHIERNRGDLHKAMAISSTLFSEHLQLKPVQIRSLHARNLACAGQAQLALDVLDGIDWNRLERRRRGRCLFVRGEIYRHAGERDLGLDSLREARELAAEIFDWDCYIYSLISRADLMRTAGLLSELDDALDELHLGLRRSPGEHVLELAHADLLTHLIDASVVRAKVEENYAMLNVPPPVDWDFKERPLRI